MIVAVTYIGNSNLFMPNCTNLANNKKHKPIKKYIDQIMATLKISDKLL